MIVGCFASLGFFALSGVINIFLKKYIPALSIIAISFAAYPYMIVINTLFVNLYKARKDEKKYLKIVIEMLILAIIYNFLAKFMSSSSLAIAVATTIAFITWFVYSSIDFKYLKLNFKEAGFLLLNLFSFLILSHYFNWIIGGVIYLVILVFSVITFLNDEYNEIKNFIKNKL